ncbi:putative GNAT family acetyltransferase [Nocardia transvalensis]|uniref:Putative GNAT family acetyltransferase n=1 Tax=Nocardia transvalensis TaxID=37333 RepID=A0A7W9UIK7_9NOCA|nr:GNAT family N-acetyltransferase [Nocardia transvalensis]MBB5914508.1 putative GNAT family acetyltransferase [Nocardia transvalensis]
MTEQAVTTAVVRNDAQHRYEVWYGDKLAGFAEYRERDTDTVFIHTEIDSAFGGKGLGSILARDAITDVIARGRAVVPRCAFIKSWLDKHPEFDEHVVGKGIQR